MIGGASKTGCIIVTESGNLCGSPVVGALAGKDYCAHHGLQAVMAKLDAMTYGQAQPPDPKPILRPRRQVASEP